MAMYLSMLIMGIIGVGMLAFGSKRALAIAVPFEHPSELGGAGASTGDQYDKPHQRHLVDEPIKFDPAHFIF